MRAPPPERLTLRARGLAFGADALGSGPLVLCLHGFPDTRATWRPQLPALAAAGFRAVAPSLRGYEPSSVPPDGDVAVATLAGDVLAWMDALGAERAHLVGHDWGALLTWAVAARAPERVASVATLAVPPLVHASRMAARHPRGALRLWYIGFFQLPRLPERALGRPDGRLVRRLWRDWSPGWSPPPRHLDDVVAALREPGVAEAALGYYRALKRLDRPEVRETWRLLTRPLEHPALLLTGARDGCLASEAYEDALVPDVLPAGHRLVRVPDAGHFLHLERPDVVTPLLVDWLLAHG